MTIGVELDLYWSDDKNAEPDWNEKILTSVKCQGECFDELRAEPGPSCQAQSTFSKTVLLNDIYYCKSGKMMESKLICQRMDRIQCRLLKSSKCGL
jgi:hypothetical protein